VSDAFQGHIILRKPTHFLRRSWPFSPTMSSTYQHICELFEQLAKAHAKGGDAATALVQTWFREHDDAIPRIGPQAIALLSCLLPARRTDRVCGYRDARLRTTVQNAQGLGRGRILELRRWRDEHGFRLHLCCGVGPVCHGSIAQLGPCNHAR
jgi:DNA ligase N terminus